jgi:hypothetical protein
MKESGNKPQTEIQDKCADLIEHINLMRDFATTPGNGWLAKAELAKINQIIADIDKLLDEVDKKY